MRGLRTRTMAAASIAALALAGCSGGDGGDGGDGSALGADASPEEVVAEGLGNRLENGAAFALRFDGDFDKLEEAGDGESFPPEVEEMLTEGHIRGAFQPEGGFAMTVGADDGFLAMRYIDEALYLRLDLAALTEVAGEEAGQIPPPEQLQGQLGMFGLPPEVEAVAEAALSGEWIGITGLTQEQLQDFAESMGQTMPDQGEVEDQQDEVMDILEEHGLTDGTTFTEEYLQVEGDGPTYDITVMARQLVTTLNEISTEVEGTLGAAGGDMEDMPEADEVPETLSGFTVTVEDGAATSVSADLVAVAESAGEDTEGAEPGDMTIIVDMSDIGDELSVPDATTIAFEDLVSGVMGGMMGGGLSG